MCFCLCRSLKGKRGRIKLFDLIELTHTEAKVSVRGVAITLPNKHIDHRRTIYEHWVEGIGLVQVLHVVSDDGPLGKHYHKCTEETFTILRGSGEVLFALTDEDDEDGGVTRSQRLAEGDVVEIKPLTAHTFYLEPGTAMGCIASHPYDPDDVFPTPWLIRAS